MTTQALVPRHGPTFFPATAGFCEGRHARVEIDRRLDDQCRAGCTGTFSQTHAEIEQRFLGEMTEQPAGCGFGADMPGDAVIEGTRLQASEHGGSRTVDVAIQDHRRSPQPAGQNGARHGGNFPSAQTGKYVERIAQMVAMKLQTLIDHDRLAVDAVLVEAGSGSGPVEAATAEECCAERRRRCRVADAHFTDAGDVRLLDRLEADPEGLACLAFGHRRSGTEVAGRPFEFQRYHLEAGAQHSRELVDGSAARLEIGDHLVCDSRGERRYASGRHAMISGKHHAGDRHGTRRVASLPGGEPAGNPFKLSKRTRRLGKLAVT